MCVCMCHPLDGKEGNGMDVWTHGVRVPLITSGRKRRRKVQEGVKVRFWSEYWILGATSTSGQETSIRKGFTRLFMRKIIRFSLSVCLVFESVSDFHSILYTLSSHFPSCVSPPSNYPMPVLQSLFSATFLSVL